MRFRLAFGINVETMAQCRRLQVWAKRHAVEMGQVGACRAFFDVDKFEPKLPSRFFAILRLAALIMSMSLLVPVPLLMTYGSALAKLKDSGRWILLDADSARSLLPFRSERLTATWCFKNSSAEEVDSFNPDERRILCTAFGGDGGDASARAKAASELAAFVQDAIWAQRLGLALLAAMLILCSVLCARWLAALDAAARLSKRLGAPTTEVDAGSAAALGEARRLSGCHADSVKVAP